jgi:hypothetical protein
LLLPRSSAGECQQPILHGLDEWLVAPGLELPDGREGAPLAGGAAGQLHKVNCLVQYGAGVLWLALKGEGGREVGQDNRLELFLTGTKALRGVLER